MAILAAASELRQFGVSNPAATLGSALAGAFIYMTSNVMVWSKNVLEFMFFTGIIGCVSVVIISWVSIPKSAFSESNED